ncbi:MAG TPA: DUF6125 family protein [Dehalococcoidia bacterium]|nr:DUF6125 family protein [Dehalococcoidia bacterium]
MKTLQKNELKEILIKNWMTHDAMWFYHCLQECGIERTNNINKAVVRAMGTIEIRRIQKAVGIQNVATFEDVKSLLEAAWDIVKGDFMKSSFSLPAKNILRGDFERCFAYEGIKGIGAIEQYQCGIFERIYGWFDGLGMKYSVSPQVKGCMMHTDGKCFREITFAFDK